MKISQKLTFYPFLLCLGLMIGACTTTKSFTKLNKQTDLIVGNWLLESAEINGNDIPAAMLGGEVFFLFESNGSATFSTPDGTTEIGKYVKRKNMIYDPEAPDDDPVEIVSLDKEKMTLKMKEEGKPIIMNLIRQKAGS